MYPGIPGDPRTTVWEPLLYMYGFDLAEYRRLVVVKRKRMEICTAQDIRCFTCGNYIMPSVLEQYILT
jgi:hypothetical protein